MSLFTKATKTESKLRMAISGPSGAGKTYTALELATGMAGIEPLKGRADDGAIAVIDTEHGSARKYSDRYNFDVLELDSFHHNKYIDAIIDAEKAGYKVLVIDSLSHCWFGRDGAMEQVDKASTKASGQSGNKFAAWSGVTPLQNKLIDTIIASKMHIIATMRTKTEYVLEEKNGRQVPRKVGLAPIQREGIDFEFDLAAVMDRNNTLTVDKSRCPEMHEQIIEKPDRRVAVTLLNWLSGVAPEPATAKETAAMSTPEQRKLMALYLKDRFGDDNAAQKAHFVKHTQASGSAAVTEVAMNAYLVRLTHELAIMKLAGEAYGDKSGDMLKASLTEWHGALALDELDNEKVALFHEQLENELTPVAAE